MDGVAYLVAGPDLIAPQTWDVRAQGDVAVPCQGWIAQGLNAGVVEGFFAQAPTAIFRLSRMGPHILMVMAEGECGAILATRTGDGLWSFGQTRNGREEITLWGAGNGPMQVWVGSATAQGCDAALTLETFDR